MQSRRSHSLGQVAAALGLAVAAASAHAAVVNHADVGGIRTFQDTLTGRIWADLDSYQVPNLGNNGCACHAYASYGAHLAALQAAGFTWANTAEVNALTATIPLGNSSNYVAARNAMVTDWGWLTNDVGAYADAGGAPGDITVHFASSFNNVYSQGSNAATEDFTQMPFAGLWAFYGPRDPAPGGNNVPEPASWVLAALALAGASWARRRRSPTDVGGRS